MKKLLPPFLLIVIFLFSSSLPAITIDEVIALSEAGFEDSTIISILERTDSEYDLITQDLIKLKEAGVSEEIITYMLKAEEYYEEEGEYEEYSDRPRVEVYHYYDYPHWSLYLGSGYPYDYLYSGFYFGWGYPLGWYYPYGYYWHYPYDPYWYGDRYCHYGDDYYYHFSYEKGKRRRGFSDYRFTDKDYSLRTKGKKYRKDREKLGIKKDYYVERDSRKELNFKERTNKKRVQKGYKRVSKKGSKEVFAKVHSRKKGSKSEYRKSDSKRSSKYRKVKGERRKKQVPKISSRRYSKNKSDRAYGKNSSPRKGYSKGNKRSSSRGYYLKGNSNSRSQGYFSKRSSGGRHRQDAPHFRGRSGEMRGSSFRGSFRGAGHSGGGHRTSHRGHRR